MNRLLINSYVAVLVEQSIFNDTERPSSIQSLNYSIPSVKSIKAQKKVY